MTNKYQESGIKFSCIKLMNTDNRTTAQIAQKRFKNVLKTSRADVQDVLKTSRKGPEKVLKTSIFTNQYVVRMFLNRFQDVFRTFS